MNREFKINDLVKNLKDDEEYIIEEKDMVFDIDLGTPIFNGKYKCRRVKEYQNPNIYVFEEDDLEFIEWN